MGMALLTSNPMKTLFLTIALLLPTRESFCESALYSFSGLVTTIQRDAAGTIAALGWGVGDSVAVTFEVDFASPGMTGCLG